MLGTQFCRQIHRICRENLVASSWSSTPKIQSSTLSLTSENFHQHSVIKIFLGLLSKLLESMGIKIKFESNHCKNIEHPKIGAVIVSAERILLGSVYSKLLPFIFKSGRRHLPLVFTSRTGQTKRFLDYLSLPNQDEFYFEGQNLIFF